MSGFLKRFDPRHPISPEEGRQLGLHRFEGYPYITTRVIPALYHIIALPEANETDLCAWTRLQVMANKLETCLVLAANDCFYFDADGKATRDNTPPTGGNLVHDRLEAAAVVPWTDDRRRRAEALRAYVAARKQEGYINGDPMHGGRRATPEDFRRLAGKGTKGLPLGLIECDDCSYCRGEYLDTNPAFLAPLVVPVHCKCQNDNLCAKCLKPLAEWKLNSNYYDDYGDRRVWHVPGFSGLSHRCAPHTAIDD